MSAARFIQLTPDEVQKLVRDTWEQCRREAAAKEILTLEEAAEILDLHPKVVIRYTREHGLPMHRIGKEYRFRRSELLEWLDSRPVK